MFKFTAFVFVATVAVAGVAVSLFFAWHYWGPRRGAWDTPMCLDQADGTRTAEAGSSMPVVFRVA